MSDIRDRQRKNLDQLLGYEQHSGQRFPHFRIFLASPGDVEEEREHVRSIIEQIRMERPFRDHVNLQCIAWDQPGVAVSMQAVLTPQEAIARGMPKPSECDLVVVILWSRMGTPLPSDYFKPDGSSYLSGTEWEYHEAVTAFQQQGRPSVWLYRRSQPLSLTIDDPKLEEKSKQWSLVDTFFDSLSNQDGSIAGGVNSYATPDEFQRLFEHHLRDWLHKEFKDFKDTGEAVDQNDYQALKKPPDFKPDFLNERIRGLSEALEAAYQRKEELLEAGQDTTAVWQEILNLRRQMREGAQLKADDFLLDGRFKLIARLGRGGFAMIWKAVDTQCRIKRDEVVAIKVLHGQHVDDRTRRERFFRGARQMAALQHQGIVRVLEEKLEDEGYYFFVMEYLAGGDLHQAVLSDKITVQERLKS